MYKNKISSNQKLVFYLKVYCISIDRDIAKIFQISQNLFKNLKLNSVDFLCRLSIFYRFEKFTDVLNSFKGILEIFRTFSKKPSKAFPNIFYDNFPSFLKISGVSLQPLKNKLKFFESVYYSLILRGILSNSQMLKAVRHEITQVSPSHKISQQCSQISRVYIMSSLETNITHTLVLYSNENRNVRI